MNTQAIKGEATEQDLVIRFISPEKAPFENQSIDESLLNVSEAFLNWRFVFHYDNNGVDSITFEVDSFTIEVVKDEYVLHGEEIEQEVIELDFSGWKIVASQVDTPQVGIVIVDFANKTVNFEDEE